MEREKGNPEFSEKLIRRPYPWPFPWPDPAPDIRRFLDENREKEFIKLQINYRIKEMKMKVELLEDMEKFI